MFLGINATPDANPLTVIARVRETFPEHPAAVAAGASRRRSRIDATEFINASIKEVSKTLAEAAIIVIIVIFLFLGNVRSTLVPVVTIPLSLVGVAVFLLALGYSINLLTLLAFVLAIGLVVDDAIVVVENIHRHIEEGMTPFESALARGARDRRPGHHHDADARRGLCADRLHLGPDRRAVPRIRLHACGRRHRLGRHRADAFADDVLEDLQAARAGRLVRPSGRARIRRAFGGFYSRRLERRHEAAAGLRA